MRRLAAICALSALVGPACAQSGELAQDANEPRGLGFFSGDYERAQFVQPRFEAEPFIWYVAPGGDVGVQGSPLLLTADLNIDDPNIGGGAEIHLHQGKWRFSLLGSVAGQQGGSVAQNAVNFGALAVAPGDSLHTEFDMTTFGLRVGYRFWEFAVDPDESGTPMIRSSLEAVAGLRAYDYSLSVERVSGAGGRAEGDMFQIEPIVGMKWSIEFDEQFAIDLATNLGYIPEISNQSSSSLDITAGFRYMPTPSVAAQIGYRLLVYDLASDDVETEGALAGLYGGVTLSF